MRCRTRWIVGVGLAACMSIPLIARPQQDVPLVPVPPPPFGRTDEAPAAKATSAPPSAEVQTLPPPKVEEPPEKPTSKSTKVETPPSKSDPVPPVKTDVSPKGEAPPVKKVEVVPPGSDPVPAIGDLVKAASQNCTDLDSYIARFTRRELVNGNMAPEQLILFKFRKQPWSVHLKWLSDEGKGREIIYSKVQHQGKIHTRLAAGDVLLMPAGKRLALTPDNPLVRSSLRHPIHEIGIVANVERLEALQAAIARGDRKSGDLVVRTGVKRAEFSKPVVAIEHTLPAGGIDTTLPKGGKRTYFLQPDTNLPVLIHTTDHADKEVEYYRYDRLQRNVRLDDADFDPELLYGKK